MSFDERYQFVAQKHLKVCRTTPMLALISRRRVIMATIITALPIARAIGNGDENEVRGFASITQVARVRLEQRIQFAAIEDVDRRVRRIARLIVAIRKPDEHVEAFVQRFGRDDMVLRLTQPLQAIDIDGLPGRNRAGRNEKND